MHFQLMGFQVDIFDTALKPILSEGVERFVNVVIVGRKVDIKAVCIVLHMNLILLHPILDFLRRLATEVKLLSIVGTQF